MSMYSLVNPAINHLLRSPWHHVLSKRIMTVSYLGRKSGKRFDTPVSYYRNGDRVYCFTNGSWRHNFTAPHPATLHIAGRDYSTRGQLFEGNRERQVEIMSAYFKAVPQDRKFYDVECGADGDPVRSQVEQALGSIVIIEFELQNARAAS